MKKKTETIVIDRPVEIEKCIEVPVQNCCMPPPMMQMVSRPVIIQEGKNDEGEIKRLVK